MKTVGNLVVLNSISADHILNPGSFPTPGGTVAGSHYQVVFSDKGTNQAVTASRSGTNVTFITCTGGDDIGESVRRRSAKNNIGITPISVISGGSTGMALIFVNDESESVIGIHAGMNAALSPVLVETQRDRITQASILFMQLELPIESVLTVVKITHRNKTMVALNPAPACELSNELLVLVDIITPSETEAEKLTGIRVENGEDVAKTAQTLHTRGTHTALITLGSHDVWASADSEGQRIPGFKMGTVDTTAAGDTFDGALTTTLLKGTPLPEVVHFIHATIMIVVTRKDTQPSVP